MKATSLFFSQIVPNDFVKKCNVSQAANNFCQNINDLRYFSHHIAIPPGNVDLSSFNHFDKLTGIEYHLCRKLPHRGIGKIANITLDNLWMYLKVLKSKENNIWFYNVWTGNIIAYLLILFFSSKRVFILLADYNPARYKGSVGTILIWAIKKAKGVLSLSCRCNEVNNNFKSIPGLVFQNKIHTTKGVFHNHNNFLLSGTLNKNTGLELALSIFKYLPKANLYLSGNVEGVEKSMIEEYCAKYRNIHYQGYFEKITEYVDFLQHMDFILSLRDPSSQVNHYNFPSKILESLAYNKVVISTIEYPELEGIKYITTSYKKEALIEEINEIIQGNNKDFIESCRDNSDILIKKYSEQAWIDAFKTLEKKYNDKDT